MSAKNLNELAGHLQELSGSLRQAVDGSVEMAQEDPEARDHLAGLWEEFLGDFYQHVRTRSRETGQNLLGWLSFSRIAP